MVTYLDRACVASAAPAMVRDLHLTAEGDLKWAFAAFGFAYALFEVPSGWLGDVFGPRRVLIRIVLWWSLFTALTGVVGLKVGGCVMGGLFTLGVLRFLFGMGEAGAYPNITRRPAQLVSLHRTRLHPRRGVDGRPLDGRPDPLDLDVPGGRGERSRFAGAAIGAAHAPVAALADDVLAIRRDGLAVVPGVCRSGSATAPRKNRASTPPSWPGFAAAAPARPLTAPCPGWKSSAAAIFGRCA